MSGTILRRRDRTARPPRVEHYSSAVNKEPKPFKWTKSADDILAAVKRFCLRVEQNLCNEL